MSGSAVGLRPAQLGLAGRRPRQLQGLELGVVSARAAEPLARTGVCAGSTTPPPAVTPPLRMESGRLLPALWNRVPTAVFIRPHLKACPAACLSLSPLRVTAGLQVLPSCAPTGLPVLKNVAAGVGVVQREENLGCAEVMLSDFPPVSPVQPFSIFVTSVHASAQRDFGQIEGDSAHTVSRPESGLSECDSWLFLLNLPRSTPPAGNHE